MKPVSKLLVLTIIWTLAIAIAPASGLDVTPRQIYVGARFMTVSLEDDLNGPGLQLGLEWDADFIGNVPGIPERGSWKQQVSASYVDLGETTAIGLDFSIMNNELVVVPVLQRPVTLGAGVTLYGLRTESYSDHRVIEVQQQDPIFWDRTITVRQSVDVDVDATTLIGAGLQASAAVPVFKNIPLIGTLFAGRSLNEDSTELIIMLSTRIIRDKE